MADSKRGSSSFEVELMEAKRMAAELQLKLEAKDRQIETINELHEADLRKLNLHIKDLSEQLEEVITQKIESDKRHQAIIDKLGVKNKNLTIDLNNTIQKYQLELQNQRGSFAKRSSVIAVAMLNKLSAPLNPPTPHGELSSKPPRSVSSQKPPSPSNKSVKGTSKDCPHNPFKYDEEVTEMSMKRHTFGSQPQPFATENDRAVEEAKDHVSSDVSDDHSAISRHSANKQKESSEKMEELFRQISPTLPGLGGRGGPGFGLGPGIQNGEILRIIEDLQHLLKCEEIEKKQILDEHTKALQTIAELEQKQVNFGGQLFALESEKIEAFHQADTYKRMATEYESKWKDLMTKQSKIEVKMLQITDNKALDQGEMELLKAEVAELKVKTCNLQLKLNERDFLETENFGQNQKAKMELEQKLTEKEETVKLMKHEIAKVEAEKKSLMGQLKEAETKSNHLHFKVAKAEEIELQYAAMIQGLNQTIERLTRELAVHGMNGGEDILENVSEERLAFSEQEFTDTGETPYFPRGDCGFEQSTYSKARKRPRTPTNRSTSVEHQLQKDDVSDAIGEEPIGSRSCSDENESLPDPEELIPNNLKRQTARGSLAVEANNTKKTTVRGSLNGQPGVNLMSSINIPDHAKRRSSSYLEKTKDTLTKLPVEAQQPQFTQTNTTSIQIFFRGSKAQKMPRHPEEKAPESLATSKKDQLTKVPEQRRSSLKAPSQPALVMANNRRGSAKLGADILKAGATSSSMDVIKKRMEELREESLKQSNWGDKSKTDVQDQLLKLSSDLNLRIEEAFEMEKLLFEAEERVHRLEEELKLKTLLISQLERQLAQQETEAMAESRKLREQLEEATQSLVEFKMLSNDLQSRGDIEKARLQKQLKIRDFELDILRQEIHKFNTGGLE